MSILPMKDFLGLPIFFDNLKGTMTSANLAMNLFAAGPETEKEVPVAFQATGTVVFSGIPSYVNVMQYNAAEDVYAQPLSELIDTASAAEFIGKYAAKIKTDASYGAMSTSASLEMAKTLATNATSSYLSRSVYRPGLTAKVQATAPVNPDYVALLEKNVPDSGANEATWETFFATYGSHFRATSFIGSMAMIVCTANITSEAQRISLEAAFNASYSGLIAEGSVDVTLTADEQSAVTQSHAQLKAHGVGGDPTPLNLLTSWKNQDKYNEWIQSTSDPANMQFLGSFLSGIWEVIGDTEIASLIKSKYTSIYQVGINSIDVEQVEVRVTTDTSKNAESGDSAYLVLPGGTKYTMNHPNRDDFEKGNTDVFKFTLNPRVSFRNISELTSAIATLQHTGSDGWQLANCSLFGLITYNYSDQLLRNQVGWRSLAAVSDPAWLDKGGATQIALNLTYADLVSEVYTNKNYFKFDLSLTIDSDSKSGTADTIQLVIVDEDYLARQFVTSIKNLKPGETRTVTADLASDENWPNGVGAAKLKVYLQTAGDDKCKISSVGLTGHYRDVNHPSTTAQTTDQFVSLPLATAPFTLSTDTTEGTSQQTLYPAAEAVHLQALSRSKILAKQTAA